MQVLNIHGLLQAEVDGGLLKQVDDFCHALCATILNATLVRVSMQEGEAPLTGLRGSSEDCVRNGHGVVDEYARTPGNVQHGVTDFPQRVIPAGDAVNKTITN